MCSVRAQYWCGAVAELLQLMEADKTSASIKKPTETVQNCLLLPTSHSTLASDRTDTQELTLS